MEVSSNKQVIIMKISSQEFKDSFYYIAPGKDFEPLIRFSNQCKYFFYANLYLNKDEVLDYISRYFKDNFFLELLEQRIYDDFDETTYFDLHPQYRHHLSQVGFLGAKNFSFYEQRFYPARNKKQWLIELKVLRKDLKRIMTLYYFTGEGLASYIALSHNGLFQPKILCTIETKVLEHNKSIMLKFFEQIGSSPEQWLRGLEGDLTIRGDSFYIGKGNHNDSLKVDPIFNTKGMDFGFHWDVEGSYLDMQNHNLKRPTTRLCKTIIKESYAKAISERKFKTYDRHAIVSGDIYDLVQQDPVTEKWVIVTKYFDKEKLKSSPNTQVFLWEEILQPSKRSPIYKCSLRQSLKKLAKTLNKVNQDKIPRRIYMVPFGMEDEGLILDNFLADFKGPELCVVVSRPLDLIDLRQF